MFFIHCMIKNIKIFYCFSVTLKRYLNKLKGDYLSGWRSFRMYKRTYTGKGIGVAVLDTGIFPHIDFGSRIAAFHDFTGGKRGAYDDNGHGTHVSGILAGDGTASGGKYRGAAPGCSIIALKILDRFGNGSREDVMRAFQWIAGFGKLYHIRIINISVGTTSHSRNEQTDLLTGVEKLWDMGFVVVAAAGNQGQGEGTVTAPGSSRKIITVDSSDMLQGRRAVSGRGPTADCVCKPDLVAPGKQITACAPGLPYSYGIKSGTSMSTPLVSGGIACLLEKEPQLSNVEVKMLLRESTDDIGLPRNQQGWGKFNCEKLLKS